jgi:hypothetical protein
VPALHRDRQVGTRPVREGNVNDAASSADSSAITISVPGIRDSGRASGVFRCWATGPDGKPARIVRGDGKLVWVPEDDPIVCPNVITTQLAQLFTQIMSRTGVNASGPAGGLYTTGPFIGLTTVAPTVASTLGTITEAIGNGYARVAPTWVTVAGPPAGYNNNASPAVFTASGGNLGGGALTSLIVTPASSGAGSAPNVILQASAALIGGPWTIPNGVSLNVVYSWTVA